MNPKVESLIKKGAELELPMCEAVDVRKVIVGSWVAWKCQYGCKYYGQKLSCPPYAPEPSKTKGMLAEYETALLVKGKVSWQVRYAVGELEKEAFLAGFHKSFGLGAGPCMLCESCVALCGEEQKQCKHPNAARPSMEACGIDVFGTVRNMGHEIHWSNPAENDKQQAIDVFGLVLLY